MNWNRKVKDTVWESECGLLFSAENNPNTNILHFGTCWIGDVEYSDKVGKNPLRCPYGERCEKSTLHSSLHPYYDCVASLTDKQYNYETSGDKIYLDYYHEYKLNCEKIAVKRTTGQARECYRLEHAGRGVVKFREGTCKDINCMNSICVMTGKSRDTTLVHIFGDRRYIIDAGRLTEHEAVTKGIRCTKHQIPKDIADKLIIEYENMSERQWGWMNHHPKPTRFYTSQRTTKDLLQDLQDAKEGIEVQHASDIEAKAKKEKSKRLLKAREKREARSLNKDLTPKPKQVYEQIRLIWR